MQNLKELKTLVTSHIAQRFFFNHHWSISSMIFKNTEICVLKFECAFAPKNGKKTQTFSAKLVSENRLTQLRYVYGYERPEVT